MSHRLCVTNHTDCVLQTTQTVYYRPYKLCITDHANSELQDIQTLFDNEGSP